MYVKAVATTRNISKFIPLSFSFPFFNKGNNKIMPETKHTV